MPRAGYQHRAMAHLRPRAGLRRGALAQWPHGPRERLRELPRHGLTMPGRLPLDQAESTTLDGSGNGTVEMRPDGSREYWYPDTASVRAPNPAGGSPASEAECDIMIGRSATASPAFVDHTFTGSSGDSTGHVS